MDVSGLHVSCHFSINLPWNLQQVLMWVLGQWTATALLLLAHNQTQRRILSIFRFLHLPQSWTFEWRSPTHVVHMRLHWSGDFTFGGRKLRFFCVSNLVHVNADNMLCNSWPSVNQLSNSGVDGTSTTNSVFSCLFSLFERTPKLL
jgi:hypothetical protein